MYSLISFGARTRESARIPLLHRQHNLLFGRECAKLFQVGQVWVSPGVVPLKSAEGREGSYSVYYHQALLM